MARRGRITSHVRWGVVLLVVGALAITGLAPARRAYEQRQLIAVEEQRLTALQQENDRLRERLQRLEDPAFAEKLAREELGVARPGDTVFIMPEPPAAPAPQPPVDDDPTGPIDWIKSKFGLE